ncbi:hypothetical protein LC605_32570 [Nostoc sp. CHAB 5836]|uniref:hypothetical protein n=1 Tax=Nostoc sp. CHAB 5836 TaxID=2780404 RepID=UPI001E55345D|nr:hypothetical protein [Nostoc sp. CHAB 5836]MCC5619679.1 hypothetical protein [Nostoc sp. CHAB 5836]
MMLDKNCHHDCNQNQCPFAQDTGNPNRYVCLKCGVEREINQYSSGFGSFLLLLLSLFIAFQLLVNYEKQNNGQRQQQSLNNSPNKAIIHL